MRLSVRQTQTPTLSLRCDRPVPVHDRTLFAFTTLDSIVMGGYYIRYGLQRPILKQQNNLHTKLNEKL
ncbi:MAG: hypothetical protein LH702_17560 [Phormidesmis sp. CAN_BIN44]|nr:hypothetical protein [Phormidesmis sp. CAN_BIN44]